MEEEEHKETNVFSEKVGEKERRKLKALQDKQGVWFGLGMFGMVGWSITVPTLLGAALGIWLDKAYPQPFSWTISFLFLGLISGCIIAWHWVTKEHKEMNEDKEDTNA